MPDFQEVMLGLDKIVLFCIVCMKRFNWIHIRSSRPEGFCKKGVLRNFTKFIGKHLCQSLFFNKVAGLRPSTLLKKTLWHRCFPINFVKFVRTPFLTEYLWWLLLIYEPFVVEKMRKKCNWWLMSEKEKQRKGDFLVNDRECFALSHFIFANQN